MNTVRTSPKTTSSQPAAVKETAVLENVQPLSPARQVLVKLNGLFEPAESLRWLGTRQARLGGSPMEMIEQGQADRVLRMLIRLEEGIHL